MGHGHHDNFFGEFPHDDVVREALEEESFGSYGTCRTGQIGERNDFVFKKIDGSVDRAVEFPAESRTFMLVPSRCFDRLFGGLFKDSYPTH